MGEIEAVSEPQVEFDRIGGWLILIGIGLLLTPFFMLLRILNNVLPVFSPEIWTVFATPGSAFYNPLLVVLIFLELIAFILIGLSAIILLVLFLRKAAIFPKLYVGYLVVQVAWLFIDFGLAALLIGTVEGEVSSFLRSAVPSLFWTAVWVRYCLVSERVKATFVH